jgi:hypothetical protein
MQLFSSLTRSAGTLGSLLVVTLATGFAGCTPEAEESVGLAADPSALSGEFVTYVADFDDGHSERWQTLRQRDGREIRLDFDTAPALSSGRKIWVRGDQVADNRMHVTAFETAPELTRVGGALGADDPELIALPAVESYAIVLVDIGLATGVGMTAAQAQARLNSDVLADRSLATYYNESSYGKYSVAPTSTVLGPFPYSLTACDNNATSAMATAIEGMIGAATVAMYNHIIYYFPRTNICSFGGLGEEGNVVTPRKRTWMNGSLSCVVLMQEPAHNLGLMHANTMNCRTTTFSATPASSCAITEYGSQLTTMGGGCRTLNGYERWYMQWFAGCNGVTVPGSGTFNLLPIETSCPGGIQTLQVPLGTPVVVSDPQSTDTMVNLRNFYLELRTATGTFDTYTTGTPRAGSTVFTAPTVFLYTSDNVRVPPATGRAQSSVWTELLTMTPAATPTYTGLTTVGQSFTDPTPGGATITLRAISATGASVEITRPNATSTAAATCIDGTPVVLSGPAACGAAPTGSGGSPGTAGAPGTGGRGAGGTSGTAGAPGAGGGQGPGGASGTSGSTGNTGAGGSTSGAGGSHGGPSADGGTGLVSGGCGCSVPGRAQPLWTSLAGALVIGLLRRRRRGPPR